MTDEVKTPIQIDYERIVINTKLIQDVLDENQRLRDAWVELKEYIEAIRQTSSVEQDLVIDKFLTRIKTLTPTMTIQESEAKKGE